MVEMNAKSFEKTLFLNTGKVFAFIIASWLDHKRIFSVSCYSQRFSFNSVANVTKIRNSKHKHNPSIAQFSYIRM